MLSTPVILVVAEDRVLRWALYEALAAANFRVLICRDEAHAREILPKVDLTLSLAIVDEASWPMTRSAQSCLRERWPRLPMLALPTPFDLQTLMKTVSGLLATQTTRPALYT